VTRPLNGETAIESEEADGADGQMETGFLREPLKSEP